MENQRRPVAVNITATEQSHPEKITALPALLPIGRQSARQWVTLPGQNWSSGWDTALGIAWQNDAEPSAHRLQAGFDASSSVDTSGNRMKSISAAFTGAMLVATYMSENRTAGLMSAGADEPHESCRQRAVAEAKHSTA